MSGTMLTDGPHVVGEIYAELDAGASLAETLARRGLTPDAWSGLSSSFWASVRSDVLKGDLARFRAFRAAYERRGTAPGPEREASDTPSAVVEADATLPLDPRAQQGLLGSVTPFDRTLEKPAPAPLPLAEEQSGETLMVNVRSLGLPAELLPPASASSPVPPELGMPLEIVAEIQAALWLSRSAILQSYGISSERWQALEQRLAPLLANDAAMRARYQALYAASTRKQGRP